MLHKLKGRGIKTALLRPFEPIWLYKLPKTRFRLFGDASQYGECLILRGLLAECPEKFVVDVGANDGIRHSNSYYFLQQGWSGILVEPHPVVFKDLVSLYQANPKVRCVNLACGETEGTAPLYFGADGEAAEFSTLSSEDTPYFERTRMEDCVDVQIQTLTRILLDNNCPKSFALLSIDAETFDLEVLKGLDLETFRPKWIVTENYAPKDGEKFKLLENAGYVLRKRSGVNTIWMEA